MLWQHQCLETMESSMCSSQPGWVFPVHFPSGAVLRWVWIRLKLWIYKYGIFCHYACFVLNFCSFFPLASPSALQTLPFSLCVSLSPFWQLCSALTASEKEVGESEQGKDEMLFYHHRIWGLSGEWTEWRDITQRKKAKPKITSIVHLKDKEELQAKNSGDVFWFPVGKEPTFRCAQYIHDL